MKLLILFVVFLLIISYANAEFSEENAKAWLINRIVWRQAPIEELSFATIALNSNTGLSQLKTKVNSLTNTREVALAALALKYMNQDIRNQLNYLENSLKATTDFNEREWIIQVVVNEEGSCGITYEDGTHNVLFNEEGKITSGGGDSWITFDRLNGFEFDKALEEINIECDFTSTPRISIIKKVGNSIYIIEEKFSSVANFEIENGCYSVNPSSAECSKESTFYVSWVLNKLGEDLTTENYLKDNANTDLDYAMLANIDNNQLPQLISRQERGGSFDSRVYETSFAFNSMTSSYLSERNEAKEWIESQQRENGMIGDGVKDTAVALYLVYGIEFGLGEDDEGEGDETGEGCRLDSDCSEGYTCNLEMRICEPLSEEICNENNQCEINLGENSISCSSDCFCGDLICDSEEDSISCSDCREEQRPLCGNDICETNERDITSEFYCLVDCQSAGTPGGEPECNNNGVCDLGVGENRVNCPSDCESEEPEKKGSLWWLWVIIIIFILGIIAFFVLNKMKKGKGAPSYLKPRIPPSSPQPQYKVPTRRAPRDEALESELNKSIKEAQELLKKK